VIRRQAGAAATLLAALAAALPAQTPTGCEGSASLGTFRIEARRAWGGDALPLKSISALPAGAHLLWEPVQLAVGRAEEAEVTAILVPASGDTLLVLDPQRADAGAEWQLSDSLAAIALVFGPRGLSMSKVRSLAAENRQVVQQIADYAEQTSKVETLVPQLADAEQSGTNVDAALKGFASRYGVAAPAPTPGAPPSQQAAALLNAVVPTAGNYDPLAATSAQVQQSTGLAASVASMFFGGGAVQLAAGGGALLANLKGVVFPGTDFRSAFAQNDASDSLALCTKSAAQKSRARAAYLWAYRMPNWKMPVLALAGPSYLPIGAESTVGLKAKDVNAQQLAHASGWRLAPVSGGATADIAVKTKGADSLDLDLAHANLQPGDYKLTAMWDWDQMDIDGVLHVRKPADFSHVQISPESRQKLIEGAGVVKAKLAGADFEFLEKAAVAKAGAHAAAAETNFALPSGKRAGDQESVEVDLDASVHGAYVLTLTETGGATHEMPFTVLPPNPTLSGLPAHVNLGDATQPLRFEGSDLARIESIASDAGEIRGAALASAWAGTIRLKPGLRVGDAFAVSLKVKGVDGAVSVAEAIEVFGPRPAIMNVDRSVPSSVGVELRPGELPAGTAVGLALTYRRTDDADGQEARPRVDLGCKNGGLRKALSLSPDDKVPGVDLSAASPGMLFLSLDPGLVGRPGCVLTAWIAIEPEGRSDAFAMGKVVRAPRLRQFTLTDEQTGPATYAGVLKGSDLDVIEKTGWDEDHGVPVASVPQPVAGEASAETLRIGLPWPAPAPHAPLYVWFRGEDKGRKTTLTE